MAFAQKFWNDHTCKFPSRRRDAYGVKGYREFGPKNLGNVCNDNLEHSQDVAML